MWIIQELVRIALVMIVSMIAGGFLEYHTKFYTRMIRWLAIKLDKIC